MLGIQRIIRRPRSILSAVASDPREAWTAFVDRYAEARQEATPPGLYPVDENWENRLYRRLNVPSAQFTSEFWALWKRVISELEAKGVRAGPESFKGWNDGDAALVRTIWCLTRQLRPRNVVETGVAHGVTSRFILEALQKNGSGRLWSIDHPPLETEWHEQIGMAVDEQSRLRWTYIRGSSRRHLPDLLSKLGEIDIFVHDSLHSERNVRFELRSAWAALRPGGAVIVDDIDANRGFHVFGKALRKDQCFVCEAEPLHPDMRRFNQKGLFGVILK
jgi:Methyltransferase domain